MRERKRERELPKICDWIIDNNYWCVHKTLHNQRQGGMGLVHNKKKQQQQQKHINMHLSLCEAPFVESG